MANPIIVAIDGYSSCGKSTIAKALAKYAGYTYVDTGAMYRAIGLYTLRHNLTEPADIIAALPNIQVGFILVDGAQHVTLNGEDVESQIRTLEAGNCASRISQVKEVRAFLVAQQQRMGEAKGIVMDGRDIGTVVFPNAELNLADQRSLAGFGLGAGVKIKQARVGFAVSQLTKANFSYQLGLTLDINSLMK